MASGGILSKMPTAGAGIGNMAVAGVELLCSFKVDRRNAAKGVLVERTFLSNATAQIHREHLVLLVGRTALSC